MYDQLKRLAANDLLRIPDAIFARGPEFHPTVSVERINTEPLSIIIGEHPSEYSVSPLMWNAEFFLQKMPGLFLPIDIPLTREADLPALLDLVLASGSDHFRVITITNPYKVKAFEYFRDKAKQFPGKIVLHEDVARIGATNQILVGPSGVFYVINSDGKGMLKAVDTYLGCIGRRGVTNQQVSILGAGGAARGIAYEFVKRTKDGRGTVTIYNRTVEKAAALVDDLVAFFPRAYVTARPLTSLADEARDAEVVVSSLTEGDPLFDMEVYGKLKSGTLIVDANYGDNSVLAANAKSQAPQHRLTIRDGRGMVVEGYMIPSHVLSALWGYAVPFSVYQEIGSLFSYTPKKP